MTAVVFPSLLPQSPFVSFLSFDLTAELALSFLFLSLSNNPASRTRPIMRLSGCSFPKSPPFIWFVFFHTRSIFNPLFGKRRAGEGSNFITLLFSSLHIHRGT